MSITTARPIIVIGASRSFGAGGAIPHMAPIEEQTLRSDARLEHHLLTETGHQLL